jgi:hypothetical protein
MLLNGTSIVHFDVLVIATVNRLLSLVKANKYAYSHRRVFFPAVDEILIEESVVRSEVQSKVYHVGVTVALASKIYHRSVETSN